MPLPRQPYTAVARLLFIPAQHSGHNELQGSRQQTSSAAWQVRNRDDVLTCARHMHTDSLAPVFLTSSVTGSGLELVRLFYNLLPQRQRW